MAAELFASLEDGRAHFGKGIYASQHEPAVWGTRLRILMNNYSNSNPLSFDAAGPEPQRVAREWGHENPQGHRAAFCIPLIVPKNTAYFIFERQTPDMAMRRVQDASGIYRPVGLGEDYRGRPVHRNRDVWVVRVADALGTPGNASVAADALAEVVRIRLCRLRRHLGNEDYETLSCIFELGRRLQGRSEFKQAEELYRESLQGLRRLLGEDHPEVLVNMINLATVLGTRPEAVAMLREALKKTKAILGEYHINTLTCMANLAELLIVGSKLEEAQLLAAECLEKRRVALGDGHPDTWCSLHLLANICRRRCYGSGSQFRASGFCEAEQLLRQCMEKRRAKFGESHPITISTMVHLAQVLEDQDKSEEAEHMYREANEKSQARLGKSHEMALDGLGCLVSFLLKHRKLEEAEQLCRDRVEGSMAALGHKNKEHMIDAIRSLGRILTQQNKFAEAEAVHREAVEKATMGENNVTTLQCRHDLAFTLQAQGKLEEAAMLASECLEERRTMRCDAHPHTRIIMGTLADIWMRQRKFQEAETLLRERLDMCQTDLGESHLVSIACLCNLALCLQKQGKLEKAEPLTRKCLAAKKARLGDEHQATIIEVNNLAELLRKKGNLMDAEPLHREAVERGFAVLGELNPLTICFSFNYAKLLHDQGKLEEAESIHRQAWQQRRAQLGDFHLDTLDSMHELGRLQQERGHLEEAQSLLRSALQQRQAKLGDAHPDTLSSTFHLAATLEILRQLHPAEQLLRQQGDSHPETLSWSKDAACACQSKVLGELKVAGA
ncbi:klc-2 [Symbiodinium natans]|uniref:Klc-2 protein n=1 Tax=Symbiodinium natans TaxID=878477 RepID=A0A812QR17_9DINO|nr:klc-2 [Symbiodinium natans]